MESLKKIGHKIGNIILARKIKHLSRKKQFHTLDNVKTVAILFDARSETKFKEAKNFISALSEKGTQVFALGFVEKQETIGNYLYKKDVDFFSINKVKWTGVPESPSAYRFISRKVNMLIDLTLTDYFPVKYIFALSQAEFKVSGLEQDTNADFIIKLGKNNNAKYFWEQLNHYLTTIKKA